MAALIELLYLIYMIKSNIVMSKTERYFSLFIHGSHILYILLKLCTFANVSEQTRQNILGLSMALIMMIIIIVEIVFALLIIGFLVYRLIRSPKSLSSRSPATAKRLRTTIINSSKMIKVRLTNQAGLTKTPKIQIGTPSYKNNIRRFRLLDKNGEKTVAPDP